MSSVDGTNLDFERLRFNYSDMYQLARRGDMIRSLNTGFSYLVIHNTLTADIIRRVTRFWKSTPDGFTVPPPDAFTVLSPDGKVLQGTDLMHHENFEVAEARRTGRPLTITTSMKPWAIERAEGGDQ